VKTTLEYGVNSCDLLDFIRFVSQSVSVLLTVASVRLSLMHWLFPVPCFNSTDVVERVGGFPIDFLTALLEYLDPDDAIHYCAAYYCIAGFLTNNYKCETNFCDT